MVLTRLYVVGFIAQVNVEKKVFKHVVSIEFAEVKLVSQ